MGSYLHSSVVDQYAWDSWDLKFVRLSKEQFYELENKGAIQYNDHEIHLNYILVVDGGDGHYNFDIGFGNVSSDCVRRAGEFCQNYAESVRKLQKPIRYDI